MTRRSLRILVMVLMFIPDVSFAKVEVVTSFSILKNLTEEVGATDVNVRSLIPSGTDPHGFNPRPADILMVKNAQLVLLTGWGFEPWANQIWKAAKSSARQVVVTDGLQPLSSKPESHSHAHDESDDHHAHDAKNKTATHGIPPRISSPPSHDHGPQDPHFWHDPARVRKVVSIIAQNLGEIDPPRKAAYLSRAHALNAKIEAIEVYTRERLRKLGFAKPTLLSSHDGFQYLGEAFGIRFTSVIGLSTAEELRASRLGTARELIRTGQVDGAVFEEGHADQALRTVIAKAEIPTVTLAADTLSERFPTYLEFLKNNTDRLVEVLSNAKKVPR